MHAILSRLRTAWTMRTRLSPCKFNRLNYPKVDRLVWAMCRTTECNRMHLLCESLKTQHLRSLIQSFKMLRDSPRKIGLSVKNAYWPRNHLSVTVRHTDHIISRNQSRMICVNHFTRPLLNILNPITSSNSRPLFKRTKLWFQYFSSLPQQKLLRVSCRDRRWWAWVTSRTSWRCSRRISHRSCKNRLLFQTKFWPLRWWDNNYNNNKCSRNNNYK